MGIRRFLKIRKIRKKRRKAVKKIEAAVHAFLYLNKALIRAGVRRAARRQLRRDLISSDDSETILMRFLQEIKKLKDVGDLDVEKKDEENENES